MPNNENYIHISGWMVNELGLKGNELLVYALIYGFSQDGETEFKGSISYIMKWLGCKSRQTVINTISALAEKGLIEKRQIHINGVTFNRYLAVMGSLNFRPVVQNHIDGVVQNLDWGSPKNGPNNTNNINTTNNKSSMETPDLKSMISERHFSPELEQAVISWVDYKSERREKYKETGLKSLLALIQRQAEQYGAQAVCNLIEECKSNGYKGIIWDRLNTTKKPEPRQLNRFNNFEQRNYDYAALEQQLLAAQRGGTS